MLTYVDDSRQLTEFENERIVSLQEIFQTPCSICLCPKLSKCVFGKRGILILHHRVAKAGVSISVGHLTITKNLV